MPEQAHRWRTRLFTFGRRFLISLVVCGAVLAAVFVRSPITVTRGDGSWVDSLTGALLFPIDGVATGRASYRDGPTMTLQRAVLHPDVPVATGVRVRAHAEESTTYEVERDQLVFDLSPALRTVLIDRLVEFERERREQLGSEYAAPFDLQVTVAEGVDGARYRVREVQSCGCSRDVEYIAQSHRVQLVRSEYFDHRTAISAAFFSYLFVPIASPILALGVTGAWTRVLRRKGVTVDSPM